MGYEAGGGNDEEYGISGHQSAFIDMSSDYRVPNIKVIKVFI